jgi:hypothetical protein
MYAEDRQVGKSKQCSKVFADENVDSGVRSGVSAVARYRVAAASPVL